MMTNVIMVMIVSIRVTLIVPAYQPGWEEMETLRGNNY